MQTQFPLFHEMSAPDGNRKPYVDERHGYLVYKVPKEIFTEWKDFGFGSYDKGLVWLVDTTEPFLDLEEWEGLDGTEIEIVRLSFSDFYLWKVDSIIHLNVYTKKIRKMFGTFEDLFDSGFVSKDYRKNVLWEPLHKKAIKKLGLLSEDECYGFAPLPTLGGDYKQEYLIKTNIREYLAFLAQV
ncbi:MAG: DUF1851 domain-containing protein [Leptospiraceae bacterium]|nr:DUF1851 domain-containing protein [Leptospiraceae bacterium]